MPRQSIRDLMLAMTLLFGATGHAGQVLGYRLQELKVTMQEMSRPADQENPSSSMRAYAGKP